MNKDQKLLEEAYQSIYESVKAPLYFGPEKDKKMWIRWLKKLKHEAHEDGSVSIDEDTKIEHKDLKRLPFNFRKVKGDFWCLRTKIISLEGAPKEVEGDFACAESIIDSLKGAPEIIGGDFYCDHNKLTTLEGAPMKVKGLFNCRHNNLTSLEGAPKEVGGNFYCVENSLSSLEGAPEVIGGEFDSDQFSDEDYREFVRKRKYVDGKLDKELDVDLGDFS